MSSLYTTGEPLPPHSPQVKAPTISADLICAVLVLALHSEARGVLTIKLVFLLTRHFVLSRHYRLEIGIRSSVYLALRLLVAAGDDGGT